MNIKSLDLNKESNIAIYNEKELKSFKESFTKFMVYPLRVIFGIITIGVLGEAAYFVIFKPSILNNSILIALYLILCFGLYLGIKKKIKQKTMLFIIITLGLVIRIAWAFSVKSIPISDFSTAYKAAVNITNGNYIDMMGTGYFGRFPHMTLFVLYFSKMIGLFQGNSLSAMKSVNIVLGTLNIPLIYLICKEVFKDEKKVIIGTFISAVMPASVLYSAVYCSENLAIPFYLASLYCFILVMNGRKKDELLIAAGVLLMVGHLCRMVAQIVVVSYMVYILIYWGKSSKIKFKSICYILISFIVPFIITGNLLVSLGITDRKLWNGSEPNITSILKGSNIEHLGRWNEEDANFVEKNIINRGYLEETSKNIIISRYTTTSPIKLSGFIIGKMTMQWMTGDFGGSFWSQSNVSEDDVKFDIWNKGNAWYQLFYIILILLIIKGLFNKKEYLENNIINIFYIIFCGYGLTFLILESQERYGFIISWIFIILPLTGLSGKSKFCKKYLTK